MPGRPGEPPASGTRRGPARQATCRRPTGWRSRCRDGTPRARLQSESARPTRPRPRLCWTGVRVRPATFCPRRQWSPPNTSSWTRTSASTPCLSTTGRSSTPAGGGTSRVRSAISATIRASVGSGVKPAASNRSDRSGGWSYEYCFHSQGRDSVANRLICAAMTASALTGSRSHQVTPAHPSPTGRLRTTPSSCSMCRSSASGSGCRRICSSKAASTACWSIRVANQTREVASSARSLGPAIRAGPRSCSRLAGTGLSCPLRSLGVRPMPVRPTSDPPSSHVEAERPQLLAAVVGDLVRAPRRHPDPVDPVAGHQAVESLLDLVLDDIGQRARGDWSTSCR